MRALPHVALIVINWNGRAYLETCLSSLLKQNYADFSVMVVDNASTDGSPDFVRERFPEIEMLCSPDNLGYGGGANLALRVSQADIAVILNTDLVVPADWLTNLVTPMLEDPEIGIAGCKLYYPSGRVIQHAGGYITKPQAWPGHYGLNDEDRGQLDAIRDVDYVIGAALAVKWVVLEQIGLFDEGYFLYYEDVDLCLRARQAGYRVVYIPGAWLTHIESATTLKGSAAYLWRFYRGRWRFILKHYAPGEILDNSMPAEQAWLAQCGHVEREASAAAYRAILDDLPEIWLARICDGVMHAQAVTEQEQTAIAGGLQVLLKFSQQSSELSPLPEGPYKVKEESANPPSPLLQLRAKRQIQEQPFVSRVPIFGPLIARLRAAWNSVSTKWYVRPMLQQQNEFNELVANHLAAQDARLQDLQDRLDGLEARAHDHDAWLVAQDREQSELVHDLAVIRLQLVHVSRTLDDLNRRVEHLNSIAQPHEQDRPT